MASITIDLIDDENNSVEFINGSFEVKDLELLKKFIRFVGRIRSCSLLKRGMPAISNISFNEQGMKFTCAPYEDSELYELLHVLRPVILQKEEASFHNVSGLLGRRFKNRKFSDHLKALRTTFEHGVLSGYMQIHLGTQPLFDQSILNTWLNAEQYHTDKEKEESWLSLKKSLSSDNARALIINQLHSKVKALFQLEAITHLVISKHS